MTKNEDILKFIKAKGKCECGKEVGYDLCNACVAASALNKASAVLDEAVEELKQRGYEV